MESVSLLKIYIPKCKDVGSSQMPVLPTVGQPCFKKMKCLEIPYRLSHTCNISHNEDQMSDLEISALHTGKLKWEYNSVHKAKNWPRQVKKDKGWNFAKIRQNIW